MSTKLYAAYAIDLNIAFMQQHCPTAKPIAKSWVFDYRLAFKGRPRAAHATLVPEEGQVVPVVIWEIDEQAEASLDDMAVVKAGYYTKEHMTLEVAGEMQEVLIYILRPCDYGIPSKNYLDTVTRGYLDFNLPVTTLEDAMAHSYVNSIEYK